jgi:hypothetical protein
VVPDRRKQATTFRPTICDRTHAPLSGATRHPSPDDLQSKVEGISIDVELVVAALQ